MPQLLVILLLLMPAALMAQARMQRFYVIADPFARSCRVTAIPPSSETMQWSERLASEQTYLSETEARAAIATLPLCRR